MAERKTYREKLLDPRWQRLRLEALQASDFKCEECENGSSTLHVHHRYYRRGAEPWDYELRELRVLCDTCHEQWHLIKSRLDQAIGRVEDPSAVLGFVEGYTAACEDGPGARYEAVSDGWARGFVSGFNQVNGKSVVNYDGVFIPTCSRGGGTLEQILEWSRKVQEEAVASG